MVAYIDAILRANAKALKELIKMSDSTITIKQLFEKFGYAARWEARGEDLATLKIAKNMIKKELPFETIVSATQLDPEKVRELYQ